MAFEVIPQAPNYEINEKGDLRNRATKRIRKWSISSHGDKYTVLRHERKQVKVHLPSMLWQLHGLCVSKNAPIPTSIKKGTRSLRFDSLSSCAIYLASSTHYTFSGAWAKLAHRHTKIAEWDIRYINPKENPTTKGILSRVHRVKAPEETS